MRLSVKCIAGACGLWAAGAGAQTPVTRSQAVDAALARGARLAIARADTVVARAALLTARARPNPVLATTYSKSVPQLHATVELPIDYPWLRRDRIASAQSSRLAAAYRLDFERAGRHGDQRCRRTPGVVAGECHGRRERQAHSTHRSHPRMGRALDSGTPPRDPAGGGNDADEPHGEWRPYGLP